MIEIMNKKDVNVDTIEINEKSNKDVMHTMEEVGLNIVGKAQKKAKAKYAITLPESISLEKPLKVFECCTEMKAYCKEKLGNAELFVWGLVDINNRLTIYTKYVLEGNEDVEVDKFRRGEVCNRKNYLKKIYDHPGMDKTIVNYVEKVIKEALPLLDVSERVYTTKISVIDVYKEIVNMVRQMLKSEKDKEKLENYKIENDVDDKGEEAEYVCIKGKGEFERVLRKIGVSDTRPQFLTNLKSVNTYLKKQRNFLKTDKSRAYEYTETGGGHWVYLRVYEDIMEEYYVLHEINAVAGR